MSKKILLFVFLFLAVETVNAKIYKWVDQQGATHYSEKAPAQQKALEVPSVPNLSSESSENSNQPNRIRQELESEMKAGKADRESREKAHATQEAEAKKAWCADARRRLDLYNRQIPIFSTNENNERVYLEDDARAEKIRKATEDVTRNCSSE